MTLAWNLVTRHIHPHEQLQKRIRHKISKLEQHLQHFPPDAVHLLISLERHPKTELFTVALTLRLPSNILRSEKQAKIDPIPAFDSAVKVLLRELQDLKAELRHEDTWRRKGRRLNLGLPKPLQFADTPQAAGPKTLRDTLAAMVNRYVGRLLYHVQRQLQRLQLDGEIPRGAIKAEAVVDEVVRQALTNSQKKPEDSSYRMWLYSLVRRELSRRCRQFRLDAQRNVPIEETTTIANDEDPVQGYDADRPSNILQSRLESSLVSRGESLADEHNASPDAVAAEHDLIDYLHRATAAWPQQERAVFDLHFLEGFDAVEVALLEHLKTQQAADMIDRVQSGLRGILVNAADRWSETRVRPVAV